jgi:hypothetical protein
MSFLDDIRKVEEKKGQLDREIQNRIPAWTLAVTQLCLFLRQRLSEPPKPGQNPLVRLEAVGSSVDGHFVPGAEDHVKRKDGGRDSAIPHRQESARGWRLCSCPLGERN